MQGAEHVANGYGSNEKVKTTAVKTFFETHGTC